MSCIATVECEKSTVCNVVLQILSSVYYLFDYLFYFPVTLCTQMIALDFVVLVQ